MIILTFLALSIHQYPLYHPSKNLVGALPWRAENATSAFLEGDVRREVIRRLDHQSAREVQQQAKKTDGL